VLSIAPVVIVDFSSYHKDNNLSAFKKLLVFSFQNIVFFIIPVTVIFIFIPQGIIDVLFRRGEFGISSLKITSSVLFYYCFGLFFFCAVRLLATSFYALKDTFTPARTATISLMVNATSSAILMFPLKIGGVALGTSIAALVNFILLYRALVKKIGAIDWADTKQQFIRVAILSLAAGVLCRLLWDNLSYNKYFKIIIAGGLSSFLFIIGGLLLKLKQLHYVKQWILEKK
jgi:putative peptidoglycan lipid II flippase